MKLKLFPHAICGNVVAADEFGFTTILGGDGFCASGIDSIQFHCPNRNGTCDIPLTLGAPIDGDEKTKRRWHWA